jgi:hypothetical protein
VGGQHQLTFSEVPALTSLEVEMPRLPVPTDSTALGMDAVTAPSRGRSREGRLDSPPAPTTARPRRVVTFIGSGAADARADALAFAQAIAPQRPLRSPPGSGRKHPA